MECKNCKSPLQFSDNYCNSCGAKVIRNPLTLKNVWEDVSAQVFNLDNTFLRTFKGLFSHPGEVVISFISGTRKRYMNPVGYFAIAVTLSGLMFFILRNLYGLNLAQSSINDVDVSGMNFVFDYQALLSYLSMPLYALMTWLLFRGKKRFNYTEHLVANAYITSQMSYLQVFTYLLVLGLFPVQFDVFNFAFLFVTVIYQFHVLRQMHQTKLWGTLWRGLIYVVLLLIIMTGLGTLMVIIAILTGQMSLQEITLQ
ncbi:DUF3667 domain-containing protein [Flagellimonas flava]|uniref:DUF3667 domain-containing protein n=1 Tax=Flagellimonas flava TaxID=570519 RepID=A0A1M5HJJ8_9FLAO|nr:DUF3667 domain-containing protein [Allomuricauda flava]SHG16105.1 Protein of unknown function [Allomuricauda flava]